VDDGTLIEQAMMAYGVPDASAEREEPDREVSLDYLRAKARSAYQSYQATRYDTTGRILPGLIHAVETVAFSIGAAEPAACRVRVLVYDTAAALLSRVGEPFLAWAAADRARSAAEYAEEPLLAALSAWRLSYMITGRKHPQEALGLAMTAAAALERAMRVSSPEQLSVYGALHLAAATAAAACYDRATTEAALAMARGIADRTGEANHMGTAFGPVNVAIHAISASLRLGDPRTASLTGEALDRMILAPIPRMIRSVTICPVTSSRAPSVLAVMSPNPTVVNTVTVKYSASVWVSFSPKLLAETAPMTT
jgi:hypothetical protein